MPDRVVLGPTQREYVLHQEQYATLVRHLDEAGIETVIAPVPDRPRSRRGGSTAHLPDLTITVSEIANLAVADLIAFVRSCLHGGRSRRRTDTPRRARVYLATGEEHEFEIDQPTTE